MTYGVLNIMVLPYTATAYVPFYEELKKKAILNENNPQARTPCPKLVSRFIYYYISVLVVGSIDFIKCVVLVNPHR